MRAVGRNVRKRIAPSRNREKLRSLPLVAGCSRCSEQAVCPFADLVNATAPDNRVSVFFTRYRAGEYVFMEHEPMTGLHVVCTGVVSVRSCNKEGQEYGLHLVGTGGYLNATNVMLQDNVYSVSSKVLVDADVAFLRQDEFQRALRERSGFSLKLLRQVGRQMEQLEEWQGYLACNSACERMIYLLRALANLGGEQALNGVALPATLERGDLASLIATTPETISRLLTRLRKSGLVKSSMSKIHIPDLNRLKHAVCCEP